MLNDTDRLIAMADPAAYGGLARESLGLGEDFPIAPALPALMPPAPELRVPVGSLPDPAIPPAIAPAGPAAGDGLVGAAVVLSPTALATWSAPPGPELQGGWTQTVWQGVTASLERWRQAPDWLEDMQRALGDRWQPQAAAAWLEAIATGTQRPPVVLVPTARLQAQGAYVASQDTIYLGSDLLQAPPAAAVRVLLEELGHFLDDQLNGADSPGDEGALFAAGVLGQALSPAAVAQLQAETDTAEWLWQGQILEVEQAALDPGWGGPGILTVTGSGQVGVEFAADGGAYQGELALFSVTGMETLVPGSTAFIQEAARRALSQSELGAVVVSDRTEGAARSGDLGEPDRNQGPFPGGKFLSFRGGDQIAVMLVPNGTVQQVWERPEVGGDRRPLFSVAAANPGGVTQMGRLAGNAAGGVYGFEDLPLAGASDGDFNDVLFRLEGATGDVSPLQELVRSRRDWLETPLALALISDFPSKGLQPPDPSTGGGLSLLPGQAILSDILAGTAKFTAADGEGAIAASGAARITLGSRTLYIGTQQVNSLNQNPIIALFDSADPANNWVVDTYETSGADGRGQGLAWDGQNLYAVFTIDGTQGAPETDFRRASGDAQQGWLRSYGQGGGAKVSVLGRIDLATGNLLDAAYLSALLSNGDSNTLTVDGITVNAGGNLVVAATVYFAPRRPNGSAMTQIGSEPSPFAYSLEITPDLKRVVSTAAVGWI